MCRRLTGHSFPSQWVRRTGYPLAGEQPTLFGLPLFRPHRLEARFTFQRHQSGRCLQFPLNSAQISLPLHHHGRRVCSPSEQMFAILELCDNRQRRFV